MNEPLNSLTKWTPMSDKSDQKKRKANNITESTNKIKTWEGDNNMWRNRGILLEWNEEAKGASSSLEQTNHAHGTLRVDCQRL